MNESKRLFMFFLLGMPSWALVNGTWASLASLADNVPEGYSISAYLILSLTLGNVLPFYLGQKSYLFSQRELAKIMYLIQWLGLTAGILMAVFWDTSIKIFDTSDEVSIPLFVLFFVVGACSASTSVTYFTYVSRYSPLCTTYLSTGMGAGSFLAGLMSIIQTNLFPSKTYVSVLFGLISAMYIPGLISLFILEFDTTRKNTIGEQTPLAQSDSSTAKDVDNVDIESIDTYQEDDVNTRNLQKFEEWNVVRSQLTVLVMVGLASFLGHGLIPTIISSVAGKFSKSSLTLSFTTGEAAICDPIYRFYTAYFRFETVNEIQTATFFLCAIAFAIVLLELLSSDISIFSDPLGGLLLVTLNVSFVSLFVFTNTSSFLYLKTNVPEKLVGYAYKWNGLSIQIGAVIGSLLSVFLYMIGVL